MSLSGIQGRNLPHKIDYFFTFSWNCLSSNDCRLFFIMDKQPCVYILTNKRRGTVYIGVTSDLRKRVWQHKNNLVDGFTKRYNVHHLVWYEVHSLMEYAIQREKQLKKWNRQWKQRLIEKSNLDWKDLYETFLTSARR